MQELEHTRNHVFRLAFLLNDFHILLLISPIVFCSSEPEIKYVVKKAPSYGASCPPPDIQSEYFAPEGTREVVVTWTPPTATDDDGDNTIAR